MTPQTKAPPKTSKNGAEASPALKAQTETEEPKVLDLTSLTPSRRLVKLPTKPHPEGQNFELRLVEDFGIAMQQKLLAWSRRYQELMSKSANEEKDELSEDEEARLEFLLNSIFGKVLDAPDSIKDGMGDTIRNRVVTAFTWAPVLARQEQQMEVIRRLIEKEWVTQEQVDQVMEDIRVEASQLTSES